MEKFTTLKWEIKSTKQIAHALQSHKCFVCICFRLRDNSLSKPSCFCGLICRKPTAANSGNNQFSVILPDTSHQISLVMKLGCIFLHDVYSPSYNSPQSPAELLLTWAVNAVISDVSEHLMTTGDVGRPASVLMRAFPQVSKLRSVTGMVYARTRSGESTIENWRKFWNVG